MRNKKVVLTVLLSIVFFVNGYIWAWLSIPDEINMRSSDQRIPTLDLPMIQQKVVSAGGQEESNIPKNKIKIHCSILGVLPVKEIQVHEIAKQEVKISGQPIGIYMRTKGILVVGTGVINGMNGLDYEPALDVVQSGDYITGLNGREIKNKDELTKEVNLSGGNEVILDVHRNGQMIHVKLFPVQTKYDEYKLGIWVRDDTQGLGTLTYIDQRNNFGALGHGISDIDTGELLSLSGGSLYQAQILSITKGLCGSPGELSGVIHYGEEDKIGKISKNTEQGIYGTAEDFSQEVKEAKIMEVGFKHEIETGEATLLCELEDTVKEYKIMIERVYLNSHDSNKSMVIHVTDQELLDKTGGIVQGMSGSPIIQNGKFIGAVTHVFVGDPTKGYGIFAETMLKQCDKNDSQK